MRRCRQLIVPLAIGSFCAALLVVLCAARDRSRQAHARQATAPAEGSR